ncbi:MAG TPA: hypothetical protein VMX94_02650 [Armatimonadota bacterium]|nr:hypothetical protein [Armatimonadota bacterium]
MNPWNNPDETDQQLEDDHRAPDARARRRMRLAARASEWNPHYLAYCRAHGHTPEEQRDLDREAFPGGINCGFMLWMSEQRRLFNEAHPEAFYDRHIIADHDAWSAWLSRH